VIVALAEHLTHPRFMQFQITSGTHTIWINNIPFSDKK
jgi:hypothetical protein